MELASARDFTGEGSLDERMQEAMRTIPHTLLKPP